MSPPCRHGPKARCEVAKGGIDLGRQGMTENFPVLCLSRAPVPGCTSFQALDDLVVKIADLQGSGHRLSRMTYLTSHIARTASSEKPVAIASRGVTMTRPRSSTTGAFCISLRTYACTYARTCAYTCVLAYLRECVHAQSMKICTIAAQKGGAGKTAISRNLAAVAAADGRRVLLVDLDPQGTTRRWLERRKADEPSMLESDPDPEQLPGILKQVGQGDHFDLVLVDTPPTVPAWMPDVMAASDLILIPARASTDDLDAIGATIGAAREARAEIAFVLTMVNPRASITDAVARALAQHGRVAPVNINSRVVYSEIGGSGDSVVEARDPKALEEMRQLWTYVKEIL